MPQERLCDPRLYARYYIKCIESMYSPLFPFLPPRPLPFVAVGFGISGKISRKKKEKKERALSSINVLRFVGNRHSVAGIFRTSSSFLTPSLSQSSELHRTDYRAASRCRQHIVPRRSAFLAVSPLAETLDKWFEHGHIHNLCEPSRK